MGCPTFRRTLGQRMRDLFRAPAGRLFYCDKRSHRARLRHLRFHRARFLRSDRRDGRSTTQGHRPGFAYGNAAGHGVAGLRLRNHRRDDLARFLPERSRGSRDTWFYSRFLSRHAEADAGVNPGEPFRVRLHFRDTLSYFIKGANQESGIEGEVNEPASVKDVIEAWG